MSADIQHTAAAAGGKELIVVDVTDPTKPRLRSSATATTSTHTVACVDDRDCRYAYSAGGRTNFSMIDLDNLDAPHEVDADPAAAGVQPFASPSGGHKWNFDEAGYATHTGYNGSSIFDVRDPLHPRVVTTTGLAGRGFEPDGVTKNGYNDFIHHNSFRPNAEAVRPRRAPSLANGNVLLVTEEDYEQVDCTQAGSFQTWWVKRLDGTPDAIVPLDKVELSDLGSFPLPVGAFCSAHWFDFHPSGIVTVGSTAAGPSSSTCATRATSSPTATPSGAPRRCGTPTGCRTTPTMTSEPTTRPTSRTRSTWSADWTSTPQTCPAVGPPRRRRRSCPAVCCRDGLVAGLHSPCTVRRDRSVDWPGLARLRRLGEAVAHDGVEHGQRDAATVEHGVVERLDVEALALALLRLTTDPQDLQAPDHVAARLTGHARHTCRSRP